MDATFQKFLRESGHDCLTVLLVVHIKRKCLNADIQTSFLLLSRILQRSIEMYVFFIILIKLYFVSIADLAQFTISFCTNRHSQTNKYRFAEYS